MAMLKATTCLYCGAVNPDAEVMTPESGSSPDAPLGSSLGPSPDAPLGSSLKVAAIAPELLLAMDQPCREALTPRSRWIRRFIALGAAVLLIAAFTGSCMQS
jgi:hypothetical protein